jgi:hypothetical protein
MRFGGLDERLMIVLCWAVMLAMVCLISRLVGESRPWASAALVVTLRLVYPPLPPR